MSKGILVSLTLLCLGWALPLTGQDKLTFSIGGGVSTPLNPTGHYTGVSGNFIGGVGYKINKNNSIVGEYMWSGLPPSVFVIHPVDSPTGKISLHSLTVNYRPHLDRIKGSIFGVYSVIGGGWYYRHASIDQNYSVPPATVCAPIYGWYGYACDPAGYVYTQTVAYKGVSAGGLNAGAGFTIRLSDSGWKFFTEARYHYAFSGKIATTLIPVTMGIRYN